MKFRGVKKISCGNPGDSAEIFYYRPIEDFDGETFAQLAVILEWFRPGFVAK
jgi:hypothetical protein